MFSGRQAVAQLIKELGGHEDTCRSLHLDVSDRTSISHFVGTIKSSYDQQASWHRRRGLRSFQGTHTPLAVGHIVRGIRRMCELSSGGNSIPLNLQTKAYIFPTASLKVSCICAVGSCDYVMLRQIQEHLQNL